MTVNPRGSAPRRPPTGLAEQPPTVGERLAALEQHLVEIRKMLEFLAYPQRIILREIGPVEHNAPAGTVRWLEDVQTGCRPGGHVQTSALATEILNRDDAPR